MVRHPLSGWSVLSMLAMLACRAPDASHPGRRCTIDLRCPEELVCYRGFCVIGNDTEMESNDGGDEDETEMEMEMEDESTRRQPDDAAGASNAGSADARPGVATDSPIAEEASGGTGINTSSAEDDATNVRSSTDAQAPTMPRGCVPGTYVGVFDGDVSALLGLLSAEISGTIRIHLSLSEEGELLTIEDGTLQGSDRQGATIAAKIAGRLDCATRQFDGIQLRDGKYTGPDPLLGGLPQVIDFTGTADATYFDAPPSAQGRWQVLDGFGLPAGSGIWTARIRN